MRYSFHGKVRATGQQVDGYVEAETSTEAIDRLADQGIIGVYSVRAEPKQPRNAVLVAGTPEFERALLESTETGRLKRRSLPAPTRSPLPLAEQAVPLPAPVEPPPAAAAAPVPGVSDGAMLQLVDKLSILIGQMQKFLDRPAQVIYQTGGGGGREGGGRGGKRPSSRNISDAQNSTLKDIFQNNLDLRRSLQKLAETVTPAAEVAATNGSVAPSPVGETSTDEPPSPPGGGAPIDAQGSTSFDDAPVASASEVSHDDPGHELSMHVLEEEHERHAQPAA